MFQSVCFPAPAGRTTLLLLVLAIRAWRSSVALTQFAPPGTLTGNHVPSPSPADSVALRAQAPVAARARARDARGVGDARALAPTPARHRLRGGGVPEPARVLVSATRDGDGARHGVHARVRVLQRRHWAARSRRPARARAARRGDRRARSAPRRDHFGGPRRPRGRRRVHFVRCIEHIRARCPHTTIEILTPDFRHKDGAIERVAAARPDVYNHNVETVPRLYRRIRPGASFDHSVDLLRRVKRCEPATFTKSGLMVGLGEEPDEVLAVRRGAARRHFLTIGHTCAHPRHAPSALCHPRSCELQRAALARGFLLGIVFSAPRIGLPCRFRFPHCWPPARSCRTRPLISLAARERSP